MMLNQTKIADFGFVGENGVTEVCFDFSDWQSELGSGTVVMFLLLPGSSTPQEATVATSGTIAKHALTSSELSTAGKARLQVTYAVSGKLAKSRIWDAVIHESLEVEEDENSDAD